MKIFSLELSSDAHIWQLDVKSSLESHAIISETQKNWIPSSPIVTMVADGPVRRTQK